MGGIFLELYKHQFYTLLRENMGLFVVSCGAEGCGPEHVWGPGQRDFCLLHLVKRGKGFFEQNGITYSVAAGQAFLIFPDETVSYRADREDPWEYAWVGFSGADAARLCESSGFEKKSAVINTNDGDRLFMQLRKVYEARGNTPGAELLMCAELLKVFAFFSDEKLPVASRFREDYATKAIRYIENNFCNDIRVENIAAAVGISRSQLFRVFKQRYEMSLCRFLTKYRVNMAAELLKKEGVSVGEAAYSVGFFDQLYFSRVFKKEKGLTPSQYIQKNRKKSVR